MGASGKGKQKIARCCSLECALRFCKPEDEEAQCDDDDGDGMFTDDGGGAAAAALRRAGQHNPEYLSMEQERFAKLTREPARKAFVIAQVPPAKLTKGSMIAANTVVCNTAFKRFFGVSETLISVCKQTPKAAASSSARRYD